ncbi:hypothetical protein [Sediminicoccus sp. KRV36]|uniref:hypothetical protein n=1 Tax=Sediminicoccus sp. KRV36 TaxID=3133721 RepID=UPI00200F5B6E|nr:hypothetical protein [Sediminicoccus rosea]UPY35116.1 hypothetical protein LHU95_12835 [Sediminicoccus rosea]
MRLKLSTIRVLALLTVSVGVAGCARVESGFAWAQGGLSGTYDRFGPNWGGMRPTMPNESLTVQRIRGQADPLEPLRPEPGDVWPGEDAPRATLANPEEALRGIRTSETEPRRTRGTSGYENSPGAAPPVMSPIFEAPTPPPRANRTDGASTGSGQVFQSQQGPVVGTGGSGRVQSTVSPQGSGLAIRDGATTTLIGPGGNVQQVPTPR